MKGKLLGRTTLPLIAAGALLIACNSSTTVTPGMPTAFAAARLQFSGTPDPAFGGGSNGVVLTNVDPALFNFAFAIAVQPDNKIIAAGSDGLSGQGTIAMVRYSSNGILDTGSFGTAGTGGIVRTATPAGWTSAGATAVTVQPADNKILLAAVTVVSSSSSSSGFATGIMLARYNANGTSDTTFNSPNGYVVASIGPGVPGDTCAMVLQADGKIVVAGGSQNGNIVLYRYNSDGSPDTTGFGTMGTGGSSFRNLGDIAMSPGIALQPADGKIIVVGGTSVDQVVLRFNTNGTLDTSFGATGPTPGIVTTDIGGTTNFGNAVAVQSDGGIVVVGHSSVNFNINTSDISLVRYNSDGSLDTTFVGAGPNPNPPGIVTTDLGGTFDNAFSIVLQTPLAVPTNIIVAGNTGNGGLSNAVVLRYLSTGALDTTFGPAASGVVILPIFGPSNVASANGVAIQTSTGIVVAGYD
jgi:uncharacterized delta-60 repeat protein